MGKPTIGPEVFDYGIICGWSELPEMKSPQGAFMGLTACDSNGFIYLVGGADYDASQFHSSKDRNNGSPGLGKYAWEFQPEKNTWFRIPNVPGTARGNPGTRRKSLSQITEWKSTIGSTGVETPVDPTKKTIGMQLFRVP